MIKSINTVKTYKIETEVINTHECFSNVKMTSSIDNSPCSKLYYNMVYNYNGNIYSIGKECSCSFALLDAMGLCESNNLTLPIIEIYQIFTEKDARNLNGATDLIRTVIAQNPNSIIIAVAGASKLEYEEEPSEEEYQTILDNLKPFYERHGFVDMNSIIGGYEFKCTYVYVGNDNIGIAKLAMEMLNKKLEERRNNVG